MLTFEDYEGFKTGEKELLPLAKSNFENFTKLNPTVTNRMKPFPGEDQFHYYKKYMRSNYTPTCYNSINFPSEIHYPNDHCGGFGIKDVRKSYFIIGHPYNLPYTKGTKEEIESQILNKVRVVYFETSKSWYRPGHSYVCIIFHEDVDNMLNLNSLGKPIVWYYGNKFVLGMVQADKLIKHFKQWLINHKGVDKYWAGTIDSVGAYLSSETLNTEGFNENDLVKEFYDFQVS